MSGFANACPSTRYGNYLNAEKKSPIRSGDAERTAVTY
jgi:hypothetical protein